MCFLPIWSTIIVPYRIFSIHHTRVRVCCSSLLTSLLSWMRLKLCERWKRTNESSLHSGKIRTVTTVKDNFALRFLLAVPREQPFGNNRIRWIPEGQRVNRRIYPYVTCHSTVIIFFLPFYRFSLPLLWNWSIKRNHVQKFHDICM